jgi:uncharacterized membrane protein
MEFKVRHAKVTSFYILVITLVAYSIWGILHTIHGNISHEGFIGVLAGMGLAVGVMLALCILLVISILIAQFFKWMFKEDDPRDEDVLFTLRKPAIPKMPKITIHKKVIAALTPKGKPVIKEFDDEDSQI